MRASIEVVKASEVDGRLVAAIRLRSGELLAGQIFVSPRDGRSWRIGGVGFIPPQAWSLGMRAVSLDPLEPGGVLGPGDVLSLDTEA